VKRSLLSRSDTFGVAKRERNTEGEARVRKKWASSSPSVRFRFAREGEISSQFFLKKEISAFFSYLK
jgi:hypothetical protein